MIREYIELDKTSAVPVGLDSKRKGLTANDAVERAVLRCLR